jgi:hypothetical protein
MQAASFGCEKLLRYGAKNRPAVDNDAARFVFWLRGLPFQCRRRVLLHASAVVWLGSDLRFSQPTRRETGGFRFAHVYPNRKAGAGYQIENKT